MSAEFEILWEQHQALKYEIALFSDHKTNPIHIEYDAAVWAAARAKSATPKKLRTLDHAWTALPEEERTQLKATFQARITAVMQTFKARSKELEGKLEEAAKTAELSPLQERTSWLKWQWIYGAAYNSQGLHGEHYLWGDAKEYVRRAKMLGVDAKVERGAGGLDVWVMVANERDVALLDYKSKELPLRDQIKAYLKAGLNPRVYFPTLPYGLEAQLGLDIHGNDLKPET